MDPAGAAIEARAKARKEAEEAFYNAELNRMASERAQMASMADRIVAAIEIAEARNNEMTIQDITSADKMDELISKSNSTRLSSLETLNDLQSSFLEMKASSNYEKLIEEIGPIVDISEESGPEAEGKDGAGEEEGNFRIVPAKTLAMEAKEQKIRLAEATKKLNKIFESGHKEYNQLVLSMTASYDDGAQAVDPDIRVDGEDSEAIQEALIPMLQKKMAQLSASLEMATLKAEAMSVQLIADKAAFMEKENKMQRTMEALDIKLQVATNKKRFGEQIDRDPNMVGGIVSKAEYEEAVRERNEAREEMKRAKKETEDTLKEFASLKTRVYEAEKNKVDNETTIAKLEKDLKQAAKATEAMETLKEELQEKERELTVATTEAQNWKQKFEDGSAKLEQDIMKELQKVLGAVRAMDGNLDKEESRISLLVDRQISRVDRAKEDLSKLQGAVGSMQESLTSTQEQLETMSLASAQSAGGMDDVKNENERLKSELDNVNRKLEDTSSQLEDANRQLGLLTEQSSIMEEQLRVATAGSDADSVRSMRSRLSAESIGGPDDHRLAMTTERSADIVKDVMSDSQDKLRRGLKRLGLSDEEVDAAVRQHARAVSKKAHSFGVQMYEMGLEDEEIEKALCAHVAILWESLEGVVVESRRNLKAVQEAADEAATNQKTKASAGHDEDDISVLTAESVPFDAGEDEEDDDFRHRELTLEEQDLLEQMKEALRSGTLADLGTIKKENFDRLRNKGFGGDDIIELTIMEHNIRYDDADGDEADNNESIIKESGDSKSTSREKSSYADRRKRMQINMMTMLQEQTLAKVIELYDFSDLSTFKTNSEREIRLLRSFSALKALKHYYDGGNFMDVLTTHRDIIDRAIDAKGGWKAAMEEVKAETVNLKKDTLAKTDHWPDFFRVKVLEFYKRALQSQQERFQLTMDLFQQKSMEKSQRDAARLEEQKEKTRKALEDLEELKKKKKKPLRSVKNASREKESNGPAAGGSAVAPASVNDSNNAENLNADAPVGEESPAQNLEVSALSSPGLEPPEPDRPSSSAVQEATESSKVMMPGSRPTSGTTAGIGSDGLITDPVPPTAPGTSNEGDAMASAGIPASGSKAVFANLHSNDGHSSESDLLADRVVQDGGTVSIVDKSAAVESKHRMLMAAMAEQDAKVEADKQIEDERRGLEAPEAVIAARLHRPADKLMIQVLRGNQTAAIISELIMQTIDDWKVGYVADAAEPLEEAIDIAANAKDDTSHSICSDIMEMLHMDVKCPREAIEIHDKIEAIFEYLDSTKTSEGNDKEDEDVEDGEQQHENHKDDEGTFSVLGSSSVPQQVNGDIQETEMANLMPANGQVPLVVSTEPVAGENINSPRSGPNTPSNHGHTQMYINEEITIATHRAALNNDRKAFEESVAHFNEEKDEFLRRRNDLVGFRLATESWQARLNKLEGDLREAQDRLAHDQAYIEEQKENVQRELNSLVALRDEPVIQTHTQEDARVKAQMSALAKSMTSKDKADAMIAAADEMLQNMEQRREEFENHCAEEVRKLRHEKQLIAKEKISQFKIKGDLLKRENILNKERSTLDTDKEAFEIYKKEETAALVKSKEAFEVYRAREEKKLADDKEAARSEDVVGKSGSASGKSKGLGHIIGGLQDVGMSKSLSEVTSATAIASKLALKRKKQKAERAEQERIDKIVSQRVSEEVEVRLAKALAMTQVDQIEVGTQTIAAPPMNVAAQGASSPGDGSIVEFSAQADPGSPSGTTFGVDDDDISISSGPIVARAPPPLTAEALSMVAAPNNGSEINIEEFLRTHPSMAGGIGQHHGSLHTSSPLSPPPVLPPGFILVHCEDSILELCPGVTYASYSLLEPWEIERVPPRVLYARRKEGEAFSKGIRRLPRYVECPRIRTAEAVTIPEEGLLLSPGVRLIINSKIMVPHMELPNDVLVACVEPEANLPSGMTKVDLQPEMHVDVNTWPLPKGLDMVQCNYSIILPPGTHIAKGCVVAAPPRDAPPLPANLVLIKRKNKNVPIPSFLVPTITVSKKATDLFLDARMAESCEIVKKPFGLNLGPGMELLRRPPGHSLPEGVKLVTLASYPEALRANPSIVASMHAHGVELVRLPVRVDLPETCCFDESWYAYPRPLGMRLPVGVGLFQYRGSAGGNGSAGLLPSCLNAVPMPVVPYGVSIPRNVLAAEIIHDGVSFLPSGTRLGRTLVVEDIRVLNPSPGISKDPKLVEEVTASNLSHFEVNEHLTLVRRVRTRSRRGATVDEDENGGSEDKDEDEPLDDVDQEMEDEYVNKRLPPLTIRAGAHDYPTGILMEESNEMLVLHARYEVPAGVKIGAGAVLGPNTQLAPGTILNHDLEVIERPYGMALDPGQELVRLEPGASMPSGYNRVVMTLAQAEKRGVPADCIIVSLPHHVHLSSNQQLAEKVCVVDVRLEASRRKMKTEMMKVNGGLPPDTPNVYTPIVEEPHLAGLDPGTCLLRRQHKRCMLPNGLSSLPRTSLSHATRRFMANNPGGNMSLGGGQGPSGLTTAVEVCALEKCFSFPISGIALAPGLITLKKPWWLSLSTSTQWLELVSTEALARAPLVWRRREVVLRAEAIIGLENVDVESKAHALVEAINDAADDSVATEVVEEDEDILSVDALQSQKQQDEQHKNHRTTHFALPEGTTLISMPQHFQVHSWGPSAPGLEVVNMRESSSLTDRTKGSKEGINASLPHAHFFVERSRDHPLPEGMRAGFSPAYDARSHHFRTLPPGVSIIHVEPTYHLPRGCAMESTAQMRPLPLHAPLAPSETNQEDEFPEDPSGGHTHSNQARAAKRKHEEELRREHHQKSLMRLAKDPHTSFNGHPIHSLLQLGAGQPLGAGVVVLPLPSTWLSANNPHLFSIESNSTENITHDDASKAAKANEEMKSECSLIFVAVRKDGQYRLPYGCNIHPESHVLVQQHYLSSLEQIKSQNGREDCIDIVLLKIPPLLPPPRELLKEDLSAFPPTPEAANAAVNDKCETNPRSKQSAGNNLCGMAKGKKEDYEQEDAVLSSTEGGDLRERLERAHANGSEVRINMLLRNPSYREPPPRQENIQEEKEGQIGEGEGEGDDQRVPNEQELEGSPQEDQEEEVDTATSFYDKLNNIAQPSSSQNLDPSAAKDSTANANANANEVENVDSGDAEDKQINKPEGVLDGVEQVPVVRICRHCGMNPNKYAEDEGNNDDDDNEEEWQRDEEGNLLLDEDGNLVPLSYIELPSRRVLMERLELSADEIHELEIENNGLRIQLKDLKYDRQRKIRRLAVFAFRQQNRDRNFLVLRNEISDLKAEIVKRMEINKIKSEEIREEKQKRKDLQSRMQAQIDVLNRQVAHWADVGEDVKRERLSMLDSMHEKRLQHERQMASLYRQMKGQTVECLQTVVANMCFLASNLYKDAQSHAAIALNHLVPLRKLTQYASSYRGQWQEGIEPSGGDGVLLGAYDDMSSVGSISYDCLSTELSSDQISQQRDISKAGPKNKRIGQRVGGDVRAAVQKNGIPNHVKGSRKKAYRESSTTKGGIVQPLATDLSSDRSISPLGFDNGDGGRESVIIHGGRSPENAASAYADEAMDDVSLLSMGDSVNVSSEYSIRTRQPKGQPIKTQMQALLISSQHDASPSAGMRHRSGGSSLPRPFKGMKTKEPLEFVGVTSSMNVNRRIAGLSSSSSLSSLQGGNLGGDMDSDAASSLRGSGSGINLPDGSVPSPNRQLKPLIRRAPGGSTQTFALSPPNSAEESRSLYKQFEQGAFSGTAEPEMSVPVNPFLSISSMSKEDYENKRRKLASLTTDVEDDILVENRSSLSVDNDEVPNDNGGSSEDSGGFRALKPEQYKKKMTMQFTSLMAGLEKAIVTSSVGSINSLNPSLPPVKITDDHSTSSEVSITITVPPVPVRALSTDTDTGDVQAINSTGIKGDEPESEKRASLNTENSQNDAKEASDGGSLSSVDPAYLGTEELFKCLISAVKEDSSKKGALPSSAEGLRGHYNASLDEILNEEIEDDNTGAGLVRTELIIDPTTGPDREGEEVSGLQVNPWFIDVKSALRRWRKEVEKNLLTLSQNENRKYVEALGAAETEVHILLQNRLKLEKRVIEMEKTVAIMRRRLDLEAARSNENGRINVVNSAEQATRELELIKKIGELEQEVIRLRHSEPFTNTIEFMRAQGDHAIRLREVKRALQFQAMIFAQKAKREEDRITLGSGSVEVLPIQDRKAIQHLANSMRARSKVYADRAKFADQELDRVLQSVIADLEAFEKAVKSVLPKKSIIQILRWGVEKSAEVHQ